MNKQKATSVQVKNLSRGNIVFVPRHEGQAYVKKLDRLSWDGKIRVTLIFNDGLEWKIGYRPRQRVWLVSETLKGVL
jgi:hypothetical protein